MKVLIIHPSAELYGADRIMVSVAKTLKSDQVKLIIPRPGPLVDLLKVEAPHVQVEIDPEIPIIQRSIFNPKGIYKTIKAFLRTQKKWKSSRQDFFPDLVYINTLAACLLAPIFKWKKIKVITHVHEIIDSPIMIRNFTAWVSKQFSDKVVCVSYAVWKNLNRHKSSGKCDVLRNGIAPIDGQKKTCDGKVQFALFGRIKPEKGHWYLIEALSNIPKNILSKAHFNLIGGTVSGQEQLKKELTSLLHEKGLTDFVSIHEFEKDISNWMSKIDVCLIPSLMKDPYPTTVLEGMSSKKVIITTDTGGAKEAFVDQISGMLIPKEKPLLFANKIKMLIQNPELRNYIATNALLHYNNHHTLDVFEKKWQEVFNQIESQIGNLNSKLGCQTAI